VNIIAGITDAGILTIGLDSTAFVGKPLLWCGIRGKFYNCVLKTIRKNLNWYYCYFHAMMGNEAISYHSDVLDITNFAADMGDCCCQDDGLSNSLPTVI